jgi:hypothetical protein
VFIKIVFVVSAIGHVALTHLPKTALMKKMDINLDEKDAKLMYWKERTEFIFFASMAILLIYHFMIGCVKTPDEQSQAVLSGPLTPPTLSQPSITPKPSITPIPPIPSQAKPSECGLENKGNTCYGNKHTSRNIFTRVLDFPSQMADIIIA